MQFYINLTLDSTVFYNTTLQTNFVANGMNAQLTYDLYNQVNYPLEIILIVYCVLAILVAFGSVLSEKMIGIQMIQTIQIVLFAQSVMKSTPSSFSPLQILRYASGFNEVQGRDFSRVYTFSNSLSSLGLQKQFLLSYNLMYAIMIGIGCLCIFFKLKQYYLRKQVEKYIDGITQAKSEEKFHATTVIYNYLFERIFFVSVFICMYLIVFAIMLQMTSMSSQYTLVSNEFNLLCAFIAISILITMICGVILNGFFPNILLFPMLMKQAYPPVYFIYQCAFIFVVAFNYTQQYTLYVLQIMSIIFLLYIIAHRPYPQKVHTFVLILHQIFIIYVLGVYIFENLYNPNENQILYKIFDFAIIIGLFLILFLNVYRVYAFYMFLKQKNWDQYGNQIDLNYQNMQGTMDYRQLASPSAFKTRQPLQQTISDENSKSKIKKRKKIDDLQMDQISKKKDKNKKGNQDLSDIKWKQYTLNDQVSGPNSSRFDGTDRNPQPDSNRNFDKSMNRQNSNDKNSKLKKANNEQTQIKNNYSEDKRKGTILFDNKQIKNKDVNDEQLQNPYDQNGYSKQKNKKIKQDQDQYQQTRRKLKFDFNSKFK